MRIIQPSISPFSILVLVVRKNDGRWRFFVNYQALDKVTILENFPIPTINELFDELMGVIIFSKLDLKLGYYQIRVKGRIWKRRCSKLIKAITNFLSCHLTS